MGHLRIDEAEFFRLSRVHVDLKPLVHSLKEYNFWNKDHIILSVNDECFSFLTIYENHAYLNYIMTLSKSRKCGLGTTMIELITSELESIGIQRMAFYSREDSKGFYESSGYEWSDEDLLFHYGDLSKKSLGSTVMEYTKNEFNKNIRDS